MNPFFLITIALLWGVQTVLGVELPEQVQQRVPESVIERAEEAEKVVQEVQDIMKRLPKGSFVDPDPEAVLTNQTEIVFEVDGAQSVEFFARHPDSLDELYLGRARQTEPNVWTYRWDVSLLPDGNYFLVPNIIGGLGEYQGSSILVRIAKKSEADIKRQQDLKEEILKEVKEEQKEVAGNIKEAVEELRKEAEEQATPPELKQRVEKVREAALELAQSPPEISDEELARRSREVKEQVQAVGQELVRQAPQEKRDEISESARQIQEKTSASIEKLEQALKEWAQVEANPQVELARREARGVKYEDPRIGEYEITEAIVIESVQVVELPDRTLGIKVSGRAEPNTFVTLYFFSTPLIVLAKADAQGRWEYTLDRPLDEGQHAVFASVTNNVGQIQQGSEPFSFVKRGSQVVRLFELADQTQLSAVQNLQRSFAVLVAALIIFGLSLAFFIIGILARKKARDIASQ